MIRMIMRLGTALVFLAFFLIFFVTHALVQTASDSQRFVDITKNTNTRATVNEIITIAVMKEINKDPLLHSVPKAVVQQSVNDVISEEWFYGQVRVAYELVVRAVSGTNNAQMNVLELKSNILDMLQDLEKRADRECTSLFAPDICANEERFVRSKARYGNAVKRTVASFPDQVDLFKLMSGKHYARAGESELPSTLRKAFGSIETLRTVGMLLVLGAFLFFLFFNFPINRLLKAGGGLLVLAGILFFLFSSLFQGPAETRVRNRFQKEIAARANFEKERLAIVGAERVAVRLIAVSTDAAAFPVALVMGFGVLAMWVGIRRSRSSMHKK